MDKDAFVYMKQKKSMQHGGAVFFDVHRQYLRPDHVASHATEAERKLWNSHNNGEKKKWDWYKYVMLHKEQHTMIDSLAYHGYSGINNVKRVHFFSQELRVL